MTITPKKRFWIIIGIIVMVSIIVGAGAGWGAGWYYFSLLDLQPQKDRVIKKDVIKKTSEQSAVISAAEEVSPAVVSIIITKELPVIERAPGGIFGVPEYNQRGTEKKEIGGGTGFIVSSDGYIVTNKHVVNDNDAEYTVLMNDKKKYKATVEARDEIMDLAVLKIEGNNLPTVDLGNSSDLQVGQTVVAIGNALGEFRNTVSTGVISGLSRSITTGRATSDVQRLSGLIQTDASINQGNSGGPLLNIAGEVIGINTAVARGAENIGFALPINEVKNNINDVQEYGRIIRPWLGVRYIQLDSEIAEKNNMNVDHGALLVKGEARGELAVVPGSPADKAGLEANDVILEVNGQKITQDNSLAEMINNYDPGEKITLKVLHDGEEVTREATPKERKTNQ